MASYNYFLLFIDSLTAALILPVKSEIVVYALLVFKKYDHNLIFAIVLLASVLGSLFNWWLGKKLQFLKHTKPLKNKIAELANAEKKWNKILVWMLIFSPLKIIGNPLSLMAGFLNTGFKKFFIIIFASKFIYYFWLIFFSTFSV